MQVDEGLKMYLDLVIADRRAEIVFKSDPSLEVLMH